MSSRILGMGDVLSLIEQAEQVFDAEQAEAAAVKIGSGELTLEDFLEQMLAIRKMGPIGNLLGMLPGAGQMKDALAQVDDRQLDRLQAIIRGMTPRSAPIRRSSTRRGGCVSQTVRASRCPRSTSWSTASSRPAR